MGVYARGGAQWARFVRLGFAGNPPKGGGGGGVVNLRQRCRGVRVRRVSGPGLDPQVWEVTQVCYATDIYVGCRSSDRKQLDIVYLITRWLDGATQNTKSSVP